MRMNYRVYRADYVKNLKEQGYRKKAIAFMDYTDDMDADNVNSVRFYADIWDVSKSTAWKWIKEFNKYLRIV